MINVHRQTICFLYIIIYCFHDLWSIWFSQSIGNCVISYSLLLNDLFHFLKIRHDGNAFKSSPMWITITRTLSSTKIVPVGLSTDALMIWLLLKGHPGSSLHPLAVLVDFQHILATNVQTVVTVCWIWNRLAKYPIVAYLKGMDYHTIFSENLDLQYPIAPSVDFTWKY